MREGHRDRMRERIKNFGLSGLQPHEVLEYLLYYGIPRRDTNKIAHKLIGVFGSIENVLTADMEELAEISGMTETAAMLLSTLPDVFKLYEAGLANAKTKFTERADVIAALKPLFVGDKTERLYILCLDANNNKLKLEKVAEGAPAEVAVDARKVVEIAIKSKAVSIVLAHNHPSGSVEPSHNDIELTRAIAVALELVKVRLIDHLIFSDQGHYSFYEDGLVDVIGRDIDRFFKEGLRY